MKIVLKLLIFLVAITVLSAWTFRLEMDTIYRGADASNMIEEFQAYGLNQTTMIVVGIFKVMCAIFLLLGLKFEKELEQLYFFISLTIKSFLKIQNCCALSGDQMSKGVIVYRVMEIFRLKFK